MQKTGKNLENAGKKFENAKKSLKNTEKSLAMEMLSEAMRNSRRWFIISIVILVMWIATIGGFVWFLCQYNFDSYALTTDDGGNACYNYMTLGDIYNG